MISLNRKVHTLIFTLSLFSFSIALSQGRSCLTCKGSGSVYVERKVHDGYKTTWSESEVFIYKKTEKAYSTEGNYEKCGRCNGTGYIQSKKNNKRKVLTVPSDFRGKIKHHYETKYLRGIPIQIESTSINNIYKIRFKSGNWYTEYIRRDGNKFFVIADKEAFLNAKILQSDLGDIGIALTTKDYKTNNGFRMSIPITTIFNSNGKYVTDFEGFVYTTGGDMIWKSNSRSGDYKLYSFPQMELLMNKSFKLKDKSTKGNLFKKLGLIDITTDKTYIINRNGQRVGPTDQTFVGIDENSGYLYFMDNQRFVNIISNKGQLVLSAEPKQKDCGKIFSCIELDLFYIPASIKHPSINNVKPIKVTKINSDLARLNGRGFVDMSDFDQAGWASFKLLFNENEEFIINRNTAIAYKGNKKLVDFYKENNDYKTITKSEIFEATKQTENHSSALSTFEKKGKIGGRVNWAGKEKDFKPKYQSIKVYHNNVVVFQNMDGEYGFYIRRFRDGSSYFQKAEFEQVIAPTGNRVLVKEDGIWYYIEKYGTALSVTKSEVSRLKKYKSTRESYNKYINIINAFEVGVENPGSFPIIPGMNIKLISSVEPYKNNPYQNLITYKNGLKKTLYSFNGYSFIYSKNIGFAYPAFSGSNTLLLPYKSEKSGKYHLLEAHNDGRKNQLRSSSSFTFDEIIYMKYKDKDIRAFGKNHLGIFTFQEVDLAAMPGGKKSTGIFPVPIVLFNR